MEELVPFSGVKVGKGKEESGTRNSVHTARNPNRKFFSTCMCKYVSKCVARSRLDLLTLRYPSGVGVLTGVRSRGYFGKEAMHQTLTKSHEDTTMAWLEAALEHAYSHGQHSALAYLEAVVEDVLFEEEIRARIASVLG